MQTSQTWTRVRVRVSVDKTKPKTKGDKTKPKTITPKWQKQNKHEGTSNSKFVQGMKQFFHNSFRVRPKWGARRAKLGVQPFRKTEVCNRKVKVRIRMRVTVRVVVVVGLGLGCLRLKVTG